MQIIIETIVTSLAIVGLFNATYFELDEHGEPTEKAVLWFVRYYSGKLFPLYIHKPIIGCVKCMASVWGVIFHTLVFHHTFSGVGNFIYFIIFVLMVSAMNAILYKQLDL